MKKKILLFFIIILFFRCSKQSTKPLNQRIEKFQVSECKTDCGIDSIGVQTQKINSDLSVKLGYIVDCSWSKAFFKNITEIKDTLIIELDMPIENGGYPISECDCFYFFNFKIKNYTKEPRAIRVVDIFEDGKFLDERKIPEIEETPIID